MTLKDACKKSVDSHDPVLAGKIVEQLRNMGFDYNSCASFFKRNAGIDTDTFESLMYEADSGGE